MLGNPTHFCGLPRAVTWAFALTKPFMAKEAYEALILRPDFSDLHKYVPKASILKEWGGDLEFDMDAYVRWRAEEEGVGPVLPQECRRYEPNDAHVEDFAAQMKMLSALEVSQSTNPAPSLVGPVEKQGS